MATLGRLRDAANRAVRPLGAEIIPAGTAPSWDVFFAHLERVGFAPKTVFDIGVAAGTPWLYRAYPDAKYFLIDPTRESAAHMERLARSLDATVLNTALGETEGEAEIDVREEIGGSTLFEEVGEARSRDRYTVPVRRLDALVDAFDGPALCKIDVQGSEIAVLRGAAGILDRIDLIVVEVSAIATLKDAPEVAEVVAEFAALGWVLYDVVALTRRPLDGALGQLDLAFVKAGSPFREDRRWSA